ncbi:MAG: hypothetical protein MUO34_09230 [Ignavibacteriaceae bacterium]|nr:hypothetical protein [Ignavibacteriaceae bacterium]
MKNLNKLILTSLTVLTVLAFNGCDPFDDFYLTLAMDTEFNTVGAGSDIFISNGLCLSDFDDYEDNKDNLIEIRYISSAYMTIDATQGLQGQNLTLTFYQADGVTVLFQYVLPVFVAANYMNNPLEITLTSQEIDNINIYLSDPQKDKCFVATLAISNVLPSNTLYTLHSKFEFLAELKIKS